MGSLFSIHITVRGCFLGGVLVFFLGCFFGWHFSSTDMVSCTNENSCYFGFPLNWVISLVHMTLQYLLLSTCSTIQVDIAHDV